MMFRLVFDAALIGIVIAAVERSEFPGWGPMIGCVFAISAGSNLTTLVLPEGFGWLGYVVGAGVGALAIAWLCETSLKRGAIAAGIFLGIRLLFAFAFGL